jgi:pimeloyl-ACP methyl ester carboxylesterase
MKKNYSIDTKRIYLIGGSGGGYMSLLTGARHPEIWAGIASFCPIADLVRWHAERKGTSYGAHIAKIVGNPQTSAEAKAEAIRRSPVTWLAGLKVPLDIVCRLILGKKAATHAVRAFNCVAAEADRIPEADIACIGENRKVPAHYPEIKETLARKKIFLRKIGMEQIKNCKNRERGAVWKKAKYILPTSAPHFTAKEFYRNWKNL